MNLKSWKLWGALATAGIGVAVNFATEWKYNLLVWAAVLVLVVLAVWLDSMAEQSGKLGATGSREQRKPPVLCWEERNGDARRTVSTTSEKVATEFLKRVPPPL
ncbi:hypothetical protein DMB42_07420 [Nonomuraea sp. WAC 01424]|uniref:hypothetical protein n=1 Tax=Nonomuraea sp. WAC 01424 TaxID=2203200 RepID=UPI000F7AE7E2|nr:hypothetical protein [Nonomuraea sp. WAC 01424]RSN14344.1 hypothetical protein DMB42_07420 [Nonomuraea sp. WAC 01424]